MTRESERANLEYREDFLMSVQTLSRSNLSVVATITYIIGEPESFKGEGN